MCVSVCKDVYENVFVFLLCECVSVCDHCKCVAMCVFVCVRMCQRLCMCDCVLVCIYNGGCVKV